MRKGGSMEEKTRTRKFFSCFWDAILYLEFVAFLSLMIGGSIYLIYSAVRSPLMALKVLLLGVAVGIGLVPVHFLFRKAGDSPLNGLLLVLVLLALTCCLLPLALGLFS
jgi:hypothetical protein